jgi:hypothetical protein
MSRAKKGALPCGCTFDERQWLEWCPVHLEEQKAFDAECARVRVPGCPVPVEILPAIKIGDPLPAPRPAQPGDKVFRVSINNEDLL